MHAAGDEPSGCGHRAVLPRISRGHGRRQGDRHRQGRSQPAEAAAGQSEIESHGDQIVDANDAIDESQEEIKKIDNALGEGGEEAASSEEVAESEAQPTEGAPVSEAEGTPNVDGSESEASPVVPGQEPVQGEEAVIAAAVATESLRQMVNKLGVPGVTCVSHEAHSDPYTSLRLAREGFKDVIEKVWRFIRELFQKIWAKLKTWTAQIIGKIKNYEKTVADLKKKLESAGNLGTAIKDDDKVSLFKLCPAGDSLAAIAKVAAENAGKQKVSADSLVTFANKVVKDNKNIADIAKGVVGTALGQVMPGFKAGDGTKDSGIVLLRPTGSALVISNAEGKFRVSKQKLEFEKLEDNAKKLSNYLTKSEALSVLSTLESAAKNFKADNDAILKAFEDGRKKLDDEIKAIKDGSDKRSDLDNQMIDILRQSSTIIAIGVPEIMFAKLDFFKAATTFVAKSIKAGGGDSDKKDGDNSDKKEESKSEGDK